MNFTNSTRHCILFEIVLKFKYNIKGVVFPFRDGCLQPHSRERNESMLDQYLIDYFMPMTEEEKNNLQRKAGIPTEEVYPPRGGTDTYSRYIPPAQMITTHMHPRYNETWEHQHDYVEMMVCLHGSVTHFLGSGSKITMVPGEILLINRYASHAIEETGDQDLAINFIIQPEFFDYTIHLIGRDNLLGRFLLDALRAGKSCIPYLYFRVADDRKIQHMLQSIIYCCIEEQEDFQRNLRIEIGALFLRLLSYQNSAMPTMAMSKWDNLAIEVIYEIQVNYADFELKKIAKTHGISSAYACKVVREATGKTCTELLQQRRLEMAKWMLRNTRNNIADIANAVGYNNLSYFYLLFKEHCGMSPREFRGL